MRKSKIRMRRKEVEEEQEETRDRIMGRRGKVKSEQHKEGRGGDEGGQLVDGGMRMGNEEGGEIDS